MFFNYDSFEIVAIAFVVAGVFTYFYSTSSPIINNESLVNTNSTSTLDPTIATNISNSTLVTTAPVTHTPTLDSISNLPPINIDHLDVGVQAHLDGATSTYVDTGMQTNARMWMQTIRDWINELLSTAPSNPNYVDVGVQASPVLEHASRWQSFKDWMLEAFSMRSSSYSSIGMRRVENWKNDLDSIQSVDLHDSESPLTSIVFGSPNNSSLDKLVDPGDSISQVSEIISESSLQVPSNSVYDINIYNQHFLYESLNNESNYINSNYLIDGINHTVLVLGNNILTVDPNIVLNPFIC